MTPATTEAAQAADGAPPGAGSAAVPDTSGIIIPPPEIRTIVDKTADFVARNGPQFEERIRLKESQNPRFSFMTPGDAYNAYYQRRINEMRAAQAAPQAQQQQQAAAPAQPEKPQKRIPKHPKPYEFSTLMPPISRQDLDIIRLTAQFAARNGPEFLSTLSIRENKNYQFDFMRPTHSLYPMFTRLIEQYKKVIRPSEAMLAELRAHVIDRYKVLDRISSRLEYETYLAEEKRKAEAEEDEERIAQSMIDWNDFVVVETIEFVESDERTELPPPMSKLELEAMPLEERRLLFMFEEAPAPAMGSGANAGDAEMEEDNMDMGQESDDDMQAGSDDDDAAAAPAKEQVMRLQEIAGPTKIRTDYVPKVGRVVPTTELMELCPVCGASVKTSEMDEHVRIELLDPKWKDQRAAYQAKQRDSNLVPINLKILAKMSGGDDTGTGAPAGGRKAAEEARETERKKIIWDGHTASIPSATQKLQQSAAEHQMIAMQQRAERDAAINAIGPQIPDATAVAPGAAAAAAAVPGAVPGAVPPFGAMPYPMAQVQLWITLPSGEQVQSPAVALSMPVSAFKEQIASVVGMAAGKQKLALPDGTVLKNAQSLESYGLAEGSELMLATRERGGKKN
nr:SF3a splicing factor complex subunit [Polyrhizophydium stewartii]